MTTVISNESPPITIPQQHELQKILTAVGLPVQPQKRGVPVNPRFFWSGKKWAMTCTEAYAEFIMNLFDISTASGMRPLKMFLNVAERPKGNVVSINIRDDGPAFPTGKDKFMDVFLEFMGENKDIGDFSQIGEAGLGAKIAATKLGGKLHFSWSQGNGEPICNWIADEDKWNSWDDYEYYEEDYSGPSFFNIEIGKLRFNKPSQVSPSKLRDSLESKFSTLLERHPNVEIYTCAHTQENPSNPLRPIPAPKYEEGMFYAGTVHLGGVATNISVGLIDKSDGIFLSNATVRLSRSGVVHFEKIETNVLRHLIVKNDGSPLNFQAQTFFRNTFITIDSPAFISTPIKNDLLWDNETNIRILKAIGQDSEFSKMLNKIRDRNIAQDSKTSDKKISSSYQKRLDVFNETVAKDLTSIAKELGINNLGSTTGTAINSKSGNVQNRIPNQTKVTNSKKRNSGKKTQPTVSAAGKNFKYDTVWAHDEDHKKQRARFVIDSNSITLRVNTAYEGYRKEFDADEKKESVYLADTTGQCLQDYRLQKIIEIENHVTADQIDEIQKERDSLIAQYMKILVVSKKE